MAILQSKNPNDLRKSATKKANVAKALQAELDDGNVTDAEATEKRIDTLIAEATAEQLSAIRVKLVLGTRVTAVGPASVTLKTGEVVPARTVVWCTGVKPAPIMATCGFTQERNGKVG